METNHEVDTKPDRSWAGPCSQNRGKLEPVFPNRQIQRSGCRRKIQRFVSDGPFAGRARTLQAYCIVAMSPAARHNPMCRPTPPFDSKQSAYNMTNLDEMDRGVSLEPLKALSVPLFGDCG